MDNEEREVVEVAQPATLEALLADRVTGTTGPVEVPGVGTVTVRALSRWEMIQAGRIDDQVKAERYTLACAMVAPRMTEADVAAWQKRSRPNEINAVAAKINELSGIGEGAGKSDVPDVRETS